MDFKTYFMKRILITFFVVVTCVCAGMAVMGMLFEPDARFSYEILLSPLIFGLATIPPQLVGYSKRELSVRETLVRDLIQFILIEVIVLLLVFWSGGLTSVSVAVAVVLTVLLVYITVHLVTWVNDRRTAREFNEALRKMQAE